MRKKPPHSSSVSNTPIPMILEKSEDKTLEKPKEKKQQQQEPLLEAPMPTASHLSKRTDSTALLSATRYIHQTQTYQTEPATTISFQLPSWVNTEIDWKACYIEDQHKMNVAIELSRKNIEHRTGGPFGAAIFNRQTHELISVGMNLVVLQNNSVLHAEIVAIMTAQQRLGHWRLGENYILCSSASPCMMCLGATLWAGPSKLIAGATKEDVEAIGFKEGPVFSQSYDYLQQQGIETILGFQQKEAKAVLEMYQKNSGTLYNGT
jgi:tRNA(Arg) A34 adenosine deaminase TadA